MMFTFLHAADLHLDAPVASVMARDLPAGAAEVLRDIVLNCEDPKKLREFVGSFVREITVTDSEVVVDYSLRLKTELGADTTWVAGYAMLGNTP